MLRPGRRQLQVPQVEDRLTKNISCKLKNIFRYSENISFKYLCVRSGWPLCGPTCAKAVQKNPEVLVPVQCEATFEIEEYYKHSYM